LVNSNILNKNYKFWNYRNIFIQVNLFKLHARLNGDEYAFFLNEELSGLWNQFKKYVYQKFIDTLEDLDNKIHEAIVTITPEMLENVQPNYVFHSASHHLH
jgi:hypothetical protein